MLQQRICPETTPICVLVVGEKKKKACEAVEMTNGCYWGERANLLMETMDDAKYCIAGT